jgi:hypothetical protein
LVVVDSLPDARGDFDELLEQLPAGLGVLPVDVEAALHAPLEAHRQRFLTTVADRTGCSAFGGHRGSPG